MKQSWLPLSAFCLSLAACTCLPKGVSDIDVGMKDRGIGSWYGQYFHGWTTANGEAYDMESLTAAHRTLPLGTVVRVTNVVNGRQVAVRINDRGPYVNGRILDLSHAAARELDMVRDGVTPIHLEVVGHEQLLSIGHPGLGFVTLHDHPGVAGASAAAREPRSVRLIPDVMRERRVRRVADILAAEQRADLVAVLHLA
jgi:rare lipoprotein A